MNKDYGICRQKKYCSGYLDIECSKEKVKEYERLDKKGTVAIILVTVFSSCCLLQICTNGYMKTGSYFCNSPFIL